MAMAVFTYSRVPAFNPNTTPVSVARSATGSVYDIGDTGFTTPLNLTLVATNTVTTTLVSDANGMFPDFTLVDRTSVVFKSGTGLAFVLTTTTPVPGPKGADSTVPGPPGPATTDASLLTAGTVADARLPQRLQDAELSATYAQAFGVGAVTGNAVPAIQAQIDAAAAKGGGWVLLSPGHVYDINGTIQMKSNVTLDLNGSTLRAVNNAAFADINLGIDAITGTAYNPVSIKPVVSVIGAVGARLVNVVVRGGKIDGNGANQPDLGSYANVAVHEADYTIVDVESVNSRPGITINEPVGGANTGRRAFCLFIGHALKTIARGIYRNAGYDSIGLREGAVDTTLDNVAAYQAPKGAIQIATGALRTKIIGGLYDNTEGGTDASHAIFLHSAVWVDIIGATMRANTGSCFLAFGDATWGNSKEVNMGNCAMEHTGAANMVSFPTAFTEKINIHDITFRKTGTAGGLLYMAGSTKQLVASRWAGTSASTASGFSLTSVTDFELVDMDTDIAATGNQSVTLNGCQRGRISGKYKQVSGVGVFAGTSSNITLERVKLTCSDSVQFLGGNSNMDILDCDLTSVTNANKLRIYGPDSGRVRSNRGSVTELNGTATVLAAGTSVTISHGLWVGTGTTATPRTDRLWAARDFQVSFAGNPGAASKVWVSAVTPTQVTFTVDAAPGADTALAWSARLDRTV